MAAIRVAHIVTSGGVGGVQRHIALLAPRLRPEFECEVASGPGEWLPALLRRERVSHRCVPSLQNSFGAHDLNALRDLCAWLRDGNFSLVHAHSTKAGLLGRLAAKIIGLPVLFTMHGPALGATRWPLWKRVGWAMGERLLARMTDCMITVSDADAALADKWRIRSRLGNRLIWNGVDEGAWRNGVTRHAARLRLGLSDQAFVIGSVTRLAPQKDLLTLLRAAALVPDACVLVVGDGPLRAAVERWGLHLGLESRVRWLGDRDDVLTCLRAFDVFTLSSRWEGAPYALLEAIAAGCIPVVTNVGGMPTLVGRHGIVVPVGRPDLLAEAWVKARRLPPPPQGCVPSLDDQVADTAAVYSEVQLRVRSRSVPSVLGSSADQAK